MYQNLSSWKRSRNIIRPSIKSVKSLYDVCIESLTDHMSLCQKNQCKLSKVNSVKGLMDSEFNLSPFEQLLLPILDEIAEVYNEKYFKSNEIGLFMQKLMLTQYCQTLRLKNHNKEQVVSLLQFASVKCLDLKKMLFWNNIDISMANIFPLISKFTKLQVLHVVSSPIELDCLFITLGENCPDLRELQLMRIDIVHEKTMVSEDGMRGLCVIGKCKLIHTLLLDELNEVAEEVIQIAIENLPVLKIFHHCWTVRVLANLHRKALGKKPYIIPKFALSSLDVHKFDNQYATTEDCKLAVAVCPFITKVSVRYHCFHLMDDDFLFLHHIKSLTNLHMRAAYGIEYHTVGLAPLFKLVGNSLTFLGLRSFCKVDVCDIIEFCPNLRSLSLVCIHTPDWTRHQPRTMKNISLEKLEMLHLRGRGLISLESVLLPEILSVLLSSPSLLYIDISYCDFLTDNVLTRAADLHQFPNLEQIQIQSCFFATQKGFEAMINKCKSIREFEFFDYTEVAFFRACRKQFVLRNWERDFSFDDFSSFGFEGNRTDKAKIRKFPDMGEFPKEIIF